MKFDIATLEFESFKEFLLDNFVSSCVARGLYILKTIAVPNPKSAKESICKISLKTPFIPRYSTPKT